MIASASPPNIPPIEGFPKDAASKKVIPNPSTYFL
jgi:hypothetical protein